ncbi:hypothetical protein DFQ27_002080, partial [Actinomortierella ambigua]
MASAAQTPFGSSGALLEPTGTKHAVTRSDSGRAPNFLPPGTPLYDGTGDFRQWAEIVDTLWDGAPFNELSAKGRVHALFFMTKDEPQRRCVQAYRVWDQLGQAWTTWWFAFKAAYGYLEGDLVARKELETLRIRHNESYNTFLTRYEGLVARLDDRLPEPELCFQFLRRCPLRLAEKIGKRGLNRNWQGIKDLVIDLTKAAQSKAIAKAAQDFAPVSQPVRSSPSSSTQATNHNQGRPRFPQPATPSFNRFGNNGYRPP